MILEVAILHIKPESVKQFEAVFPKIYSTALRLTRNPDEAQDLTQEAAVRAFQAYDRFDGANFRAWMVRILTNVFINKYRRSKREPDTVAMEEQPAIENLVAEYRVTVLLCDVEGMSYEEIAQALDVPIGTVRSRLARGRAALRNKLREYATEEGYLKGTAHE